MADLPVRLSPDLAARLARSLDTDGKILRALDALGPIAGREVVLIDGDEGKRARELAALAARLTVVASEPTPALAKAMAELGPSAKVVPGRPDALGLEASSADVLVVCWSAFRGPSPAQVAEADRVLRPGGRLLVVHDYGRDDVSLLRSEAQADHFAWSRRDGWFLTSGFRIRVIHTWWSFDSLEDARELLVAVGGEAGEQLAATLKRPRLSYNVAVYHRTRGEGGSERERVSAASGA